MTNDDIQIEVKRALLRLCRDAFELNDIMTGRGEIDTETEIIEDAELVLDFLHLHNLTKTNNKEGV